MKRMKPATCVPALIAMVAVCGWPAEQAHADRVQHVRLETFQVPEVVPNETLEETEPVRGSSGTLVRSHDSLHVIISSQKLPAGAYTFWWHLTHPDGEVSILWAGYALVSNVNGNVVLNSNLPEGEENAPGDIFIGHGLQPGTALVVTVELWVRYHGALSETDPERAEEQLTKPFGGCTDVRNPNPKPEDYPCWNPHRAIF